MNKAELVAAVAQRCGAPRVTVEAVINGVLETIGTRLEVGDRVTIPGFGTFEPRHRPARNGVNPATGARIQIAATTVPAFRAGQGLRGRVAGAHVPEPEPEPVLVTDEAETADLEPAPQVEKKKGKKDDNGKAKKGKKK
ncbi:MAG: HU family DNA-binding protein [Egibacteraceae bacterium]